MKMAPAVKESTPVVVGAADFTHRAGSAVVHPLEALTVAAKNALLSASPTAPELLARLIDWVVVVQIGSFEYAHGNERLPGRLAEAIGAQPRRTEYTKVGGETPQLAINRACLALETGEHKAVLIAGAETAASASRATPGENGYPAGGSKMAELDSWSDEQAKYGLTMPARVYPLIETAIRAASGRTPEQHAQYMGQLFERYSRVAAANPKAWNRKAHSAAEIATPTANNRYVVYPYTKLMNAFPTVDQSAAVVVTTVGHARALGIPEDRWVFPMGGANFVDVDHVVDRLRLDESPAIRHAARLALDQAGTTLGDISIMDIYSCFPSAVQIALKEIGISAADPRELTVTGGLPYFGGPGNNYSMHAIVEVVERLRRPEHASSVALVWANGMYVTKHAVGIYGHRAPSRSWQEQVQRLPAVQEAIKGTARAPPEQASHQPPLLERYEGLARVEAYFITHARVSPKDKKAGVSGGPQWGGAIVRAIAAGPGASDSPVRRTLARINKQDFDLESLERNEFVGQIVQVVFDSGEDCNVLRPLAGVKASL